MRPPDSGWEYRYVCFDSKKGKQGNAHRFSNQQAQGDTNGEGLSEDTGDVYSLERQSSVGKGEDWQEPESNPGM
jgi:hypothetical protein